MDRLENDMDTVDSGFRGFVLFRTQSERIRGGGDFFPPPPSTPRGPAIPKYPGDKARPAKLCHTLTLLHRVILSFAHMALDQRSLAQRAQLLSSLTKTDCVAAATSITTVNCRNF